MHESRISELSLSGLLLGYGPHAAQPSQKRDAQFPNTKQAMGRVSHKLHRNNFMMSNLRRGAFHGTRDAYRSGINQTNIMNNQFESTYALLVRSEEKGRGVLEILVYAVFALGVVLSIWQFAQAPVKISAPRVEPCVACHTTTTPPPVRG